MSQEEFLAKLQELKAAKDRDTKGVASAAAQKESANTGRSPSGRGDGAQHLEDGQRPVQATASAGDSVRDQGTPVESSAKGGGADAAAEASPADKFCMKLLGINSVYDKDTNECRCKEGWLEDADGNCDGRAV